MASASIARAKLRNALQGDTGWRRCFDDPPAFLPSEMRSRKSRIKTRASKGTSGVAEPKASHLFTFCTCLLFVAAILLVYWQTFRFGYVYYDDDRYVYENDFIRTGLSGQSLAWAFKTFYFANWHPLTWISYLIEYQFFGLNPNIEHAVNVGLHAAATILLFLSLIRMTEKQWRSIVVAAVFALHPLHVESVAWIAERKDVLCTCFVMATLLAYARYTEKKSAKRYVLVIALYSLSILAKPMAVTLPFVFLLLDWWPLRRIDPSRLRYSLNRVAVEKIPLFVLSSLASVLTFLAQRMGGAVISAHAFPLADRLSNSIVAYVRYLAKTLWPTDLAVLYPFKPPAQGLVVVASILLILATFGALRTVRSRPYFFVGWFWYLGMLVPVIGLVQVGLQSIADRYTYVPMVGISLAIVWSCADIIERYPATRRPIAVITTVMFAALITTTYKQAGYWSSSQRLFQHTLDITHDNVAIENNLGVVLYREGQREEAASLFRQALVVEPDNAGAETNLGVVLGEEGKASDAIALFRKALLIDSTYVDAHINLGHQLLQAGQFGSAEPELVEAIRLKPRSAISHADLGLLFAIREQYVDAASELKESVRLDPTNGEAYSNLCFAFLRLGRLSEALNACSTALRIKPELLSAKVNLARVFASSGQAAAAEKQFLEVLATNPNQPGVRAELNQLKLTQH